MAFRKKILVRISHESDFFYIPLIAEYLSQNRAQNPQKFYFRVSSFSRPVGKIRLTRLLQKTCKFVQ